MKANIGADVDPGPVHTVVGMAASVNDVRLANARVQREATDVFADLGDQGVGERQVTQEIQANWHEAMRPGKRGVRDKRTPKGAIRHQWEQAMARIRAKVEHPYRVIKRPFGHVTVGQRRLAKHRTRLHTLSHLRTVRRTLLQKLRGRVPLHAVRGPRIGASSPLKWIS